MKNTLCTEGNNFQNALFIYRIIFGVSTTDLKIYTKKSIQYPLYKTIWENWKNILQLNVYNFFFPVSTFKIKFTW
jgi:hypothetical protein